MTLDSKRSFLFMANHPLILRECRTTPKICTTLHQIMNFDSRPQDFVNDAKTLLKFLVRKS